MTDQPTPHLRSVYREPSDLRVLARAANEDGEQKRISFPASNIDHIQERTEDTSTIVMKSGLRISVALAMDALYEKLYRPDFRQGDLLDLTRLCLDDEDLAQKKGAKKTFNQNAGPLIITAQLRKPETNSVANVTFSEDDVRHYNVENETRAKCRQSVRIYFNATMQKKLPFSDMTKEYVMIDMPNDDFLAALQSAKANGTGKLDLCAMFAANPRKYGLNPQ